MLPVGQSQVVRRTGETRPFLFHVRNHYVEFIWHAWGGQGVFMAAWCLGGGRGAVGRRLCAGVPTFGPERRGAPMRAFTKIDTAPIGDRQRCIGQHSSSILDETLVEDGWEDEPPPAASCR